jgi:hypothetical protein
MLGLVLYPENGVSRFLKTSVNIYQIMWCRIPEESILQTVHLFELLYFLHSETYPFSHFEISEIKVHLTFDGIYELMSKNYSL